MLHFAIACTSEPPPPEPEPASPLDAGWIAAIVSEPASFNTRVADDREGWIALHRNDWLAAAAGAGAAAPVARAELSVFFDLLSKTSVEAWTRLGTTWEQRGTIPGGSNFPLLVATAIDLAGDGSAWRARVAKEPPALTERRALLSRGVTTPEDLAALRELAARPLLTERAEVGERTFYDPAIYAAIAAGWRVGAASTGAALFSASLTGAAEPVADLAALGITALPPASTTEDDGELCRGVVRALDAQLDPWKLALAGPADTDGKALLDDLRLVDGARARTLVALGTMALDATRPRCALAFAEMALDHETPRALGPVNSPTLFAVLAAANLRSGRTREALDALQVLVGPYPEVTGLDETVSDLAVLQGLDRAGDSREN